MLGTERVLRMNIQKTKPQRIALQGLRPSITTLVLTALVQNGELTAHAVAHIIDEARFEAAIGGKDTTYHKTARETTVRHLEALVKVGKVSVRHDGVRTYYKIKAP